VLLAAGRGNARAKENMTVLEGLMSRDQIAEGQKQARNFKPSEASSAGGHAPGRGISTESRQKAARGEAEAQFDLGVCYANGQGVAKHEVEAYKWWLLAGAQGDESARKALPSLEHQLTRKQVADGQKRAFDFKLPETPSPAPQQGTAEGNPLTDLRAKAATGDARAQNELGEALYLGKQGASRNPVEAVKWFTHPAELNNPAAQSNLGLCYERGDGVARYEVEAYKWYFLAAAQGDTKGKRNASMLELMLSQEEIADGKRRAQDWLEQRKRSSTNSRSEP
jgi:TPR repeat protein